VVTLTPFTLRDQNGRRRTLPGGRPAVLAFVKSDCATCQMVMPIIGAAMASFGSAIDLWPISQDEDGGRELRERLMPVALDASGGDAPGSTAFPLDDAALAASFACAIETVPTLLLLDEAGNEAQRLIGFDRAAWQDLVSGLASSAGVAAPAIDWSAYPISRPGCGSRTTEPEIEARLIAATTGTAAMVRRIEVADRDDPIEFCFEQGFTDGLPVVPPTPERVARMLSGTRRDPRSVVALVPPNHGAATVEKVAINAVMAGCRPEYLPVVIAALEAVCHTDFNIHGVLATTHFVGPVLIVNGPIREKIGINSGLNALGQGTRANATIGRAVQLIVRNVGGGRPGEIDRAVLGQPGKYSFCFAEHEARSQWEPLHVERGFPATASTVTAYAGYGLTGIIDQLSRDAESLARSYGAVLEAASHPRLRGYGQVVVIVPPEHVDTIARSGWSKARFRAAIQQATLRPAASLAADASCAVGLSPGEIARLGPTALVPKFREAENIVLVVAGGEAGKFGALIDNWAGGGGSRLATVAIDEEG
jgi:thiol-disulfide isomerase/thioredoxin